MAPLWSFRVRKVEKKCRTFPDLPENSLLVYHLTLVSLGEKWDPEMKIRLAKGSGDTVE